MQLSSSKNLRVGKQKVSGRASAVLFSLILSAACRADSSSMIVKEIQSYPHIANAERLAKIKAGYAQIAVDMRLAYAVAILGGPDEVLPLYKPNISSKECIGYTHWYVARRRVKNGSQDEKGEAVLRISYDMQGRVIAVDRWGLDF